MDTLHEDQYTVMFRVAQFVLLREMFRTKFGEKMKAHIVRTVTFYRAVDEIMWKNIVEPDWPQMVIRRTCNAHWIPKPTNTHSEYVLLIAFPR
jgi:hypothetical protein